MAIGPFINNDDLDTYARRKEAENDIADLVRALTSASLGGSAGSVRFRSGQGIRLSGFYGIGQLSTVGFMIPQGTSVWELSDREDVEKKANEDYEARSKDPKDVVPSETVYVAVSMRKWPGKETWAKEKKNQKVWKDVIAIDAGDLSTWLNATPAVASLFRRQTGLQTFGIEDADGFLSSWLDATEIPLKAEVLTISRNEQVQKIKEFLASPASSIKIVADNIEEAIAFICATINGLDTDLKNSILARTIIVHDENALRQVVNSNGGNLIIIPAFKNFTGSLEAPKKGHHLFISRDPRTPITGNEIVLTRQPEREVSFYFKQQGLAEEKVKRLVSLSRGRISVLRRLLGFVGIPEWASTSAARELIPLLLLGRWNPSATGDKELIEKHFGLKSADFEAILLKWKNSTDAPVQQSENGWEWTSRFDSWRYLSASITESDLNIFAQASREALGECDPSLTLDEGERYLAGIRGLRKKYSFELIEGLSETLALLANSNTTMTAIRSYRVEDFVAGIVRSALQHDWKHWYTLKGSMSNIAEAAPNVFLTALEENIRTEGGVRKLFSDKRDGFMGGIPQSGILWALETLAWDQMYLGRVCTILLKLQSFDNPLNNIGNRPIRSLKEILSSWHPQTLASADARIKVLKMLAKQDSKIAWELIVAFFPRGGDSATPTHPATWREHIATAQKPRATMADVAKFANELPVILMEIAKQNADRWPDFFDIYEQLPESFQFQILSEIKSELPNFSEGLKSKIQEELRDFLNRSKSYPDAEWTIKEPRLLHEAENLYNELTPTNLLEKHKWLFYGWPKFIDSNEVDDFDGHQKKVVAHRSAAMREILNSSVSPSDFLIFSDNAEQTYWVGLVFAETDGPDKANIEQFLEDQDPTASIKRREFYRAWIFKKYEKDGDSWLMSFLEKLNQRNHEPAVALALAAIPSVPSVWGLASKYGTNICQMYWETVPVLYNKEDWISLKPFLLNILNAGRIDDVARLTSFYVTEKLGAKSPSPIEILEILQIMTDKILSLDKPIADSGMFGYYLNEIFKAIEGKDGISEDDLTVIEWKLFPLIRHSTRRPKNLHRLIEKSPSLFVDLVTFIYRSEIDSENEGENVDADLKEARASQAHALLDDSWKGIAGRDTNGNLNSDKLQEWVSEARVLLQQKNRSDIGELEIGKMLARGPSGPDGIWPTEAVRNLIESAPTDTLRRGFYNGVINSRGLTTRGLSDGGDQERTLVEKYEGFAKELSSTHPRTAGVLLELADSYRADAKRQDIRSERYK